MSKLRTILGNIRKLCESAGAKTTAKDLQVFSDILKPYSDAEVGYACDNIKRGLSAAAAEKPGKRPKAPARARAVAPDDGAIERYLVDLRRAGTDREAFGLVFKSLKASKSLKLPDLAEIAHQYSLSETTYKSKAAVYSDIENAFLRQARFENKVS